MEKKPLGSHIQPSNTRDGRLKSSIVIGSIIFIILAAMIPIIGQYWSSRHKYDHTVDIVETALGFRVEKTADGDWNVTIRSGSKGLSDVILEITDPMTGAKTVSTPLFAGNTTDFIFINHDASSEGGSPKINTGDIIVLKSSSPNIKSGYRFMLHKTGPIVLGPMELP